MSLIFSFSVFSFFHIRWAKKFAVTLTVAEIGSTSIASEKVNEAFVHLVSFSHEMFHPLLQFLSFLSYEKIRNKNQMLLTIMLSDYAHSCVVEHYTGNKIFNFVKLAEFQLVLKENAQLYWWYWWLYLITWLLRDSRFCTHIFNN